MQKNKKKYKVFLKKLFLLILIAQGNCISTNVPSNTQIPLIIAIGYDVSGSVVDQGFQKLNMAHIDELLLVMKNHGGTLALGIIDEKSDESLIRLDIKPVIGRLDERARSNQMNQNAIQDSSHQPAQPSSKSQIHGHQWGTCSVCPVF